MSSSQAQVHGRHISHVSWDVQATALQGVMAKVQSEPMQELHSKGNCAAAEAGRAELPRQLWGRTMTGCSSCADNWRPGMGWGEQRQGRWWLLSSPRLAEPISDWLNMTELTLLFSSEGKRKLNGVKRLQYQLYEI